MDQEDTSLIFAMSLFLGMLLLLEVGPAHGHPEESEGLGEGASWHCGGRGRRFTPFGLLAAFDLPRVGRKVHKYRELLGPHILGFAVVTVTTVFVVLNIEFPRQGLFRADADDQVLIDLREG